MFSVSTAGIEKKKKNLYSLVYFLMKVECALRICYVKLKQTSWPHAILYFTSIKASRDREGKIIL